MAAAVVMRVASWSDDMKFLNDIFDACYHYAARHPRDLTAVNLQTLRTIWTNANCLRYKRRLSDPEPVCNEIMPLLDYISGHLDALPFSVASNLATLLDVREKGVHHYYTRVLSKPVMEKLEALEKQKDDPDREKDPGCEEEEELQHEAKSALQKLLDMDKPKYDPSHITDPEPNEDGTELVFEQNRNEEFDGEEDVQFTGVKHKPFVEIKDEDEDPEVPVSDILRRSSLFSPLRGKMRRERSFLKKQIPHTPILHFAKEARRVVEVPDVRQRTCEGKKMMGGKTNRPPMVLRNKILF